MATQYANAKIVTNGLVLALDAADRNSYVSGSATWFDLSGNNNNGTLTNNPTFNSVNGGNLNFNRSNTTVSNSAPNLPSGNSPFTKSAWINSGYKGTSSNHPNIISWGGNSANNKNGLALQTDTLNNPQILQWFFANDYSCSINDITNTWANITVTYQPPTLTFYLNGTNQSIQTVTGTPAVSGSINLEVGIFNNSSTYAFSGSIANVQVYNRAISATEITQNYNAQKSRFNLT